MLKLLLLSLFVYLPACKTTQFRSSQESSEDQSSSSSSVDDRNQNRKNPAPGDEDNIPFDEDIPFGDDNSDPDITLDDDVTEDGNTPGNKSKPPRAPKRPANRNGQINNCKVPLAVSLVIDTSCSMGQKEGSRGYLPGTQDQLYPNCPQARNSPSGNRPIKIDVARGIVRDLVRVLRPDDSIGLAFFNSWSRIIAPMTNRKNDVLAQVNQLSPDGSTNIVDGLLNGERLLNEFRRNNKIKKILILLSDGVHMEAGNPVTTAANLKSRDPDLSIVTIGYDLENAGASAMSQIASRQDYYINAPTGENIIERIRKVASTICD